MSYSMAARRKHLAEVVGPNGRVRTFSERARSLEVTCRVCVEPNPKNPNGEPRNRVVVVSEFVSKCAADWLAHEATREHQINVERGSRR